MHSCEQVIQSIWDYLDRETDKANLAEIQKHLDLCRGCFSRVEFEKILREKMQKATHHMCPDKLKQKIRDLVDRY